MGFLGNEDAWKGDSADNIWQEGYERLRIYDQLTIQALANEKFDGDIVKAMQHRFKNNIDKALLGYLPKEWQLFSDAERADIAKLQADMKDDPAFVESLENLFTALDGFDDDTPVDDFPIVKNSKPPLQPPV